MKLIKRNKIKEMLKKEGFRIGNKTLKELDKNSEELIREVLKKIVRNAIISGRKTIRIEDIQEAGFISK